MADKTGAVTPRSLARYCRLRSFPPDDCADGSKVYFIYAPAAGLIKIGHSIRPRTRFSDLVTMSPVPLKLLATIDGGRASERMLHKRFAYLRRHGEWFRACRSLMMFVESYAIEPDEPRYD
jgi:hypothetical protein